MSTAWRSEEILESELTEFSQTHPAEKFFMLNTSQGPFGFLYVGSDVCTLGWQGTLKFSQLDSEARTELPSRIAERQIQLSAGDNVSVSLVLQEQDLVEYDFRVQEKYVEYRQTISASTMISFARYNVEYKPAPWFGPINYAFTAENPQFPSSESELTVLLPRSMAWSTSLLDWVITHNVATNNLQRQIDLFAFSHKISDLSH